jgi:hypothetical protein
MWWTFQQFPFLVKPMQLIPEEYARKMSPVMNGWIDCVVKAREYVMNVNEQFKAGIKPNRRTIFHKLLDPSIKDEKNSSLPASRLYVVKLSVLPLLLPIPQGMRCPWLPITSSVTRISTTSLRRNSVTLSQTRVATWAMPLWKSCRT